MNKKIKNPSKTKKPLNLDPRQTALNILVLWHNCIHTLDKVLEDNNDLINKLKPKDKNLCNALIFGTLRCQDHIDWIIFAFCKIELNKMDIKLLYLLRIAVLQLVFMDRIPDFAIVDTSVNIAKKNFNKSKSGFVNAILRKACKEYTNIALPSKKSNLAKFIHIKYSIPLWLSKRWLYAFGFEKLVCIGKQINTIPLTSIRINTLKTNRDLLEKMLLSKVQIIKSSEYISSGFLLKSLDIPIQDLDEFKAGLFFIQDQGAQIITQILSPKENEKILDACAGLGGKTTHIAQMMKNKGHITALDVDQKKLDLLALNAKRLGIKIIETRKYNVLNSSIKDFNTYFDRVLVDAPCTGLGVLARNPDTKYKCTKKDITRLCAKQKKILCAAANLVKPDGILVYAVCSCEQEETCDVIKYFLKKRKDFVLEKNFKSLECRKLINSKGFLKTYPDFFDMDGFFAACLKRKNFF